MDLLTCSQALTLQASSLVLLLGWATELKKGVSRQDEMSGPEKCQGGVMHEMAPGSGVTFGDAQAIAWC